MPRPLQHLLRFERRDQAADDFAHGDAKWTHVISCWCSIEPLKGEEAVRSSSVENRVTHRIRTRWASETEHLDGSWRLVHQNTGRTFEVVFAININEDRFWWEIQCVEVK